MATAEKSSAEWITYIWAALLDDRDRDMLSRRRAGEVLDVIGRSHGVTRERARQVLASAEERVVSTADLMGGDWRGAVGAHFSGDPLLWEESLTDVLADPPGVVRHLLLRANGLRECRTWAGGVRGLWATSEDALTWRISELIARAPLREGELTEMALAYGIPPAAPLHAILTHQRSPLTQWSDGSWVRRRAKGRDAAYLWLAGEGQPRRASVISEAIGGGAERVLTESLRRDDRFTLMRPEGTWALTEWGGSPLNRYTSALEAMLDVLQEHAPMGRAELFALTSQLYPVSNARLQQCLISEKIGVTEDGRLDLVARGAVPVEEKEPKRPHHMVVDESRGVVGVRLEVDTEVLRGSGVIVHPWLTWYLGLRLAPMSREFTLEDASGTLTVRRNTSAAQLSSVRPQVQALGLTKGCSLVVEMRLDVSVASVRHACDSESCPTLEGS